MTQETDSKNRLVDKRRSKDLPPTKVVIRRLPPSLTGEALLEQISPLPNYDFFYFMKADLSLGANAFSRAYINFQNYEDIANFRDKFDGYIFVDGKGNEYPAIVEFAAFQKVPKKKVRKPDSKKGTIEQDPDYLKFLESLNNPETENVMSLDTYLEELEAKEREAKATKGGPKVTTPLIEFIKKRREEKRNSILRAREERKKRDQERKQMREEDRRKRKERESEREKERQRQKDRDRQRDREKDRQEEKNKDSQVKLLKNTERENDTDESKDGKTVKNKSESNSNDKSGEKSLNDKSNDKSESKKDKENSDKDSASRSKDDKSRLRFSKENREKQKEQREGKDRRDDRERGKVSPAKNDRPRSGRDDPRDRDDRRDDRRSDRPRPKSYRDDRERRLNRDQDYYRLKSGQV